MVKNRAELKTIDLEALQQLRTLLERDGGDMELIEITDDNVVRIKLLGNCSGCSMSTMTMKVGLEEAIKKAAPEIKKVEAINE